MFLPVSNKDGHAQDTVWETVDERVTRGIRRQKKKGLMHAWEQIKFEIMALGLVSLLLVVFEVCCDHSFTTVLSYSLYQMIRALEGWHLRSYTAACLHTLATFTCFLGPKSTSS
jgi:hypothetical protein